MNNAFWRLSAAVCKVKSRLWTFPFLALLSVLLPSCAMEGDFGRPKTYSLLGYPLDAAYWASDSGPILGTISEVRANRRGGGAPRLIGPTAFSQTPEEREMRESAYRLRVEIQDLTPMRFALGREGAFANDLTREKYNYGPSRLSLIEHELGADHQTLSIFAGAARRVTGADRARMFALQQEQRYVTRGDARDARNRMRKNCAFIVGTFRDIEKRIAAYDYAITRTKIETPGYSVFNVEGSLNHLRDRSTSLNYELTQSCEVANADVAFYGPPPPPPPGPAPALPPPPIQGSSYKPAYQPTSAESGGRPVRLFH